MILLAIETSCDETSAAVLDNDTVLSNIISSQLFHSDYGGVIPEVASREHLKKIVHITRSALDVSGKNLHEIELISASSQPGLIGALLVGVNFGKSLAISLNIPFVPVNHIHSHIYSNFLNGSRPEFPFIALIVSGGHTLLVLVRDFFNHKILGTTADDAAGEAFDKVARLLGLGYPGGPLIDKYAETGNKNFHKFPVANVKENEFDFSFSGIKTSVLYLLKKIEFAKNKNEKLISDICASFQESVIQSLYEKTLRAARKYDVKTILVSGGVSANSELKKKFNALKSDNFKLYFPKKEYSTDNAAMIGITGYFKYEISGDKSYYINESTKENARGKLDYANF